MTVPATEIKLSPSRHHLIVNGRIRDLPYLLANRAVIADIVEALAFYGWEGNHEGKDGRIPSVWADSGERAREVLKTLHAIKDVAELEIDS